MVNNPKESLEVLLANIRQLMRRCDIIKEEKGELEKMISERDDTISALRRELEELNIKYKNLKTARTLAFGEGDTKDARNRFNKLVREIDKCISLLNE